MPMTVLITGFGPFPGAPTNPTGALVNKLAHSRRPALTDVRVIPHIFPTSYAAMERELPELIARYKPDILLMFGLATQTPYLRIETQARNGISSLFPDAEGYKPSERRLASEGSAELRTKAPVHRLVAAAHSVGVPVRLSHDAGRYLCNALYWRGLEATAQKHGPRLAAFVHVPRLRPDFTATDLSRTGEAILLAILSAGRRLG